MNRVEPVTAAIETLRAKWWVLWLVRLFGKKVTVKDGDCTVTIRYFRGVAYLVGVDYE